MENNLGNYEKKDIEEGKGMAILSYIIPLIPYFAEKENKWVRFHAIQGMNLLIVAVAVNIVVAILTGILGLVLWRIWWLISMISTGVNIAIGVLGVLGIINVCQENTKELPLINKIKIIKK